MRTGFQRHGGGGIVREQQYEGHAVIGRGPFVEDLAGGIQDADVMVAITEIEANGEARGGHRGGGRKNDGRSGFFVFGFHKAEECNPVPDSGPLPSHSIWLGRVECLPLMLKCLCRQTVATPNAQQAINRDTLEERLQSFRLCVNVEKVIRINLDGNRKVSVLLADALEVRLALGLESVADDEANPAKWCGRKPARADEDRLKLITNANHRLAIILQPRFDERDTSENQFAIMSHDV